MSVGHFTGYLTLYINVDLVVEALALLSLVTTEGVEVGGFIIRTFISQVMNSREDKHRLFTE